MTPRASLCLLVLALAAPGVRADPTYVIEQLVVSVSSTSDAESERVGQVKSGDKLEVIEREGDATHVKLSNGKDGWIKSAYLTSDPPLQTRLTERTAEVEKLKQEGDKLKLDEDKLRQEGDRLKQDVSRLESELAAAKAAHTATSDSPPVPAPVRDTVFLRDPDRQSATPWPLLLGLAAVMLFLGFVAGWKTLDRRIRQKYGGLKIY
ncbi:MAG TPA: TIGR04211 family SH3 domain-containing protein [Steroidobacteraceae bacterium]|nr:TIGR04211 family SH3 domain-containing protein [Steroidobacteraceae bacterium]